MKKDTLVISLGGSLICPDGVDLEFLKKFKKLTLEFIEGRNQIIIVCGGGKLCRQYQLAAKKLDTINYKDLDWVGIKATHLNGELVRAMFGSKAYKDVIYNPEEEIKTNKKIVVAAGYKPGWSSDYDAVLLGKQFRADLVINMTNVSYVYDKDPKKYTDAKKIEKLSWDGFRKIIGGKFTPGMHAPFDPIASKTAQKLGIRVAIINGNNLANLKKLIYGKKFKGTILK